MGKLLNVRQINLKEELKLNFKTMKKVTTLLILTLMILLPLANSALAAEATVNSYKVAVNGDSQTITISTPDQITIGNVLVAQITYEKGLDALPIIAPAGWNHILTTHGAPGGGNKDLGQSLYWKITSSNEPISYTWTFAQKVKALGGIINYSGIDINNPVAASTGRGGEGDSTGKNQIIAPGIEASQGMKLVGFYGFKERAILDKPFEMKEIYQGRDNENDYTILASEENILQQGPTGEKIAKSFEYDEPGKSLESEWVAQLILLKTTDYVPIPTVPEEVKVIIDGKQLVTTDHPFIENGRTLVPMRALFEALGVNVSWDETNRVALGTHQGTTIRIPVGSTSPTVNGVTISIDVPAKIVNDRTYIPLRFVGESLNYTANWNGTTRTVNIIRK